MNVSTSIILLILLATPWVWNFTKFVDCDFEPNYKCEAIHGIGVLIPPAAYVTVWFGDDSHE